MSEAEQSLDLDLELGMDESDEVSSTNAELPDLSLDDGSTDFNDAATEVGDLSDPDIIEEFGLEVPGQEAISSFDTVKLGADDVSEMSRGNSTDLDLGLEVGDGETDLGMDTEFKNIFAESPADSAGSSVDFDLGADFDSVDADSGLADSFETADSATEPEPEIDLDVTVFSLPDLPTPPSADEDDEENRTLVLGRTSESGSVDDMQTKLDLAQAYMETGDSEGARNLLGEVMAEGSELQQATAREMLTKLS
jgi:pilus assembly protein FimV